MATTITQVNWYILDRENKKNYSIVQMSTMKQFKIRFSENYAANFQLSVAVRHVLH